MSFNSYIFILGFLPVFILIYFTAGRFGLLCRKLIIILAGVIFYVYAGWEVAAILGLSIAVNYLLSLVIGRSEHKKALLVITIAANIGLLLYFKYLNFSIDVLNSLTGSSFTHRHLILPLGISFFTFQQIMYVVSVEKGEISTHLCDYLAYILYFPKLIMGPLAEPAAFYEQLNDPSGGKPNAGNLASGLKLFSLGLFKKMVLADTFAKAVDWGFQYGVSRGGNAASATAGDLFLVMLFYTFQIYFDFSGYTDMATGISKMINIDLPMNFDSPYKATSIRDFWKRWHMSLTGFLTRYIYFPLGGSRKGTVRTCINIMIVFLVSGLWHGANWTFILWGAIYGLLQIIERLAGKWFDKLSDVVRWTYTFLSVSILWLLFRSDSIKRWGEMLRTMFRFQDMSVSDALIRKFELPEAAFLFDKLHLAGINSSVRGFSMLIFILSAFLICLIPENNYKAMKKTNGFNMIICALAFVWGFLCLASETTFVYFGF